MKQPKKARGHNKSEMSITSCRRNKGYLRVTIIYSIFDTGRPSLASWTMGGSFVNLECTMMSTLHKKILLYYFERIKIALEPRL